MSEIYKIQVNDSEPIEVSQQVYEVSFCFNEMLKEKDNEIERLKKDKEIDVKLNLELLDAVGKLNNILNELEKWLEKEQVNSVDLDEWTIIQVRDKILELKGDSSNGR